MRAEDRPGHGSVVSRRDCAGAGRAHRVVGRAPRPAAIGAARHVCRRRRRRRQGRLGRQRAPHARGARALGRRPRSPAPHDRPRPDARAPLVADARRRAAPRRRRSSISSSGCGASAAATAAGSRMLGALTVHARADAQPDGAERFQRRNAQGIDINRDALAPADARGPRPQGAPRPAAAGARLQPPQPELAHVGGASPPSPASISLLAAALRRGAQRRPAAQRWPRRCAA